MRQDQFEKLQRLQDKILDVFLEEADPDNWPGRGLKLAQMDPQTRGDLYWCRKVATSAAALYGRAEAMIGRVQLAGAGTTPASPGDSEEDEVQEQMDGELKHYEQAAKKLLAEVQGGKGKAAFDRKVHGRP